MVVVGVDRLPLDSIAAHGQVVPLHAGMEHIEDVIKDFVAGDFRLRHTLTNRQMRLDISIELSAGDLFWQFVVQWGGMLRLFRRFVSLVCFY